ncbi:MAG: transposase [Clostridia bacterium]|nr:transposase [Clostridia bacterium]
MAIEYSIFTSEFLSEEDMWINDKRNRIQEGNIHVYFRGNNQHNVFYDDEDKIEFLRCCDNAAKKHDTKILEFALMNNHVHLQVETKQLTDLMRSMLISYVIRYNKRKGSRDKVFATPFNSACKFTEPWIIDNMLYILRNPLKAGICRHPSEFKWSSYGFHFHGQSPLKQFITVDTSLLDDFFQTKYNLEKTVMSNLEDSVEIEKLEIEHHLRITNEELVLVINKSTNGKNVDHLDRDEIFNLIQLLYVETDASFRQIAAVTHEHYDFVRKVCHLLG